MDQYGAAIIQKFGETRHGLKEAFMHVTLGVFSIWDGNPYPFHTGISSQIAIALGTLTLFEQSNNVCTSHLLHGWEIFIPRTMV